MLKTMPISRSVAASSYDVDRIRQDFPALELRVHGKGLIYFDNAASAQKPRCVIETITDVYETSYANVHRGVHYLANAATERYEAARARVARFLNADDPASIIFTKSGTEALNLVASGLGATLQPGDEIIVSDMEHHSNIVPWHFLRQRCGAELRWVGVDDRGVFDCDGFAALLGPRTKIVSLAHMSNVLGTVVPLAEIIPWIRSHAAADCRIVIDGCQGAVHCPVDVSALDCDFYIITGHKLYGPSGIGALYGKRDLLDGMAPYQGGGEMIEEVWREDVSYAASPHRFEAGTPPIAAAIGLAAALDYIAAIGVDAILAHEKSLIDYAMSRLTEIDKVTFYGTAPNKGAIMAFNVAGVHPHDISTMIDLHGVAIRAGTHCAQPLLQRFDTTATCRASFGLYNTLDEIDRFIIALKNALTLFR